MSSKRKKLRASAAASSESQTAAASRRPIIGGSISRLISVAVLIVVIVAIGILFYRVMVGFFVPLFLAALLVVIFRPMHAWFCDRLGDRLRVAALLTTGTILLIVLLPTGLILSIAAAQGTRLLSGVNSQSLTLAIGRARETFGLSVTDPEVFRQLNDATNALADPSNVQDTLARIEQVKQLSEKLRVDYGDSPQLDMQLFGIFDEQLQQLREQALRLNSMSAANLRTLPETAIAPSEEATGEAEPLTLVTDNEPEIPGSSEWERWQDYQQTLVAVDQTRTQLQAQLLGGPLESEVKMLANPSDDDIHDGLQHAREYLQAQLPNLASATTEFAFHTVFGLVVLIIAIYFFLLDGPTMTRTLMRLSPLDDAYEERLLIEFDRTSRAVVLATISSALAQGVMAALGYYFAGMNSVILLFIATTFMALIPFLGAMSVWLPCVLWLGFVDQRWGAAIGLAIWGALVVSTIDNVIKVFILHGRSQLHPLLALLSVLGGVQVFGPIGLLVGPMIVVFLQTLLEILQHELMKADAAPEAPAAESASPTPMEPTG